MSEEKKLRELVNNKYLPKKGMFGVHYLAMIEAVIDICLRLQLSPTLDEVYAMPSAQGFTVRPSKTGLEKVARRISGFSYSNPQWLTESEIKERGLKSVGSNLIACTVDIYRTDVYTEALKLNAQGREMNLPDESLFPLGPTATGLGWAEIGGKTPNHRDAKWLAVKRAKVAAISDAFQLEGMEIDEGEVYIPTPTYELNPLEGNILTQEELKALTKLVLKEGRNLATLSKVIFELNPEYLTAPAGKNILRVAKWLRIPVKDTAAFFNLETNDSSIIEDVLYQECRKVTLDGGEFPSPPTPVNDESI